jgi:hypothetical protein
LLRLLLRQPGIREDGGRGRDGLFPHARHFDKLIWEGLGIDKHPELLPLYFGNYTKIVFLAQTRNEDLAKRAMDAAKRLGLAYEYRFTGYGELERDLNARA